MTREELLKDAKARLADLEGVVIAIKDKMQAYNDRGVETEKAILGIKGEIKALTALGNEHGI